jgi:hypothetical protein
MLVRRMLLTASLCVLLGMTAWVARAVADPGDVAISAAPAERATAVSGNQAPTLLTPSSGTFTEGTSLQFAATAVDPDPGDSLLFDVTGLPPGLHAVAGRQVDGRKEMRVYGILDSTAVKETPYHVRWTVTDGTSTQTAYSDLLAQPAEPLPIDFGDQVMRLVTTRYQHGMPHGRARALGTRALPILARMLRDDQYESSWSRVAQAIGDVGDTAYFDTLRTFIWSRFTGEIDRATFMAIRTAQGAMHAMATMSPRALQYLVATTAPSAWSALPWNFPGERTDVVEALLVRNTLIALAYTDSPPADVVIQAIPVPQEASTPGTRYQASFAQGLHDAHAKVRTKGYVAVLADQDAPLRGKSR